ncbi:hypothetical protein CYMTET_48709 [Cymbomonas tetramitiformis]|uniref:Roc domain-containing protein n=1 Tax=Cymbomonas tetramitiformis TaxID=36881 RepID=A0AAE0BTD6_9CHLO|nr:hypothetical protein CYMTET_48709 [Cymbomonas tetramitiformis]
MDPHPLHLVSGAEGRDATSAAPNTPPCINAFVSYRRENYQLATTIISYIESHPQQAVKCFLDLEGTMCGHHFLPALMKQILTSSVFIPIVTLEAIEKLAGLQEPQQLDVTLVEYLIALSGRGEDGSKPGLIVCPIVIGADCRDHNGLRAYSNLFASERYRELKHRLLDQVATRCVTAARDALAQAGYGEVHICELTVREVWDQLIQSMDCFVLSCAHQDAKAQFQSTAFFNRIGGACIRGHSRSEGSSGVPVHHHEDGQAVNTRVLQDALSQETEWHELRLEAQMQLDAMPHECTSLRLTGSAQHANNLLGLPGVLNDLASKIQRLDVSFNGWGALPEWMGQLTALQHLHVADNVLRALPDWMGQLTALQHLHVADNVLRALPEWMGQLTALQHLDVAYNHLGALPESMGQLTALQHLAVGSNGLRALPESFGRLFHLQTLYCGNNPDLCVPPKDVRADGAQAAVRYMAYLSTDQGAPCHDTRLPDVEKSVRIMLIGQGSVGKTSMQCALRSPPHHRAVAIEIDDRTDGISIEEWRPKEGFVGHIWDFAGQEEYYSTHMFFLSARAIYIMVWKLGGILGAGGKDEEMIYFWLESLHLHAPGSTVMLVGTHLEDPDLPLTEEQVQQQTCAVQRLAQQQLQNHDKRLENQKSRLASQIRDFCIDARIPRGSNDGQDVSLHELKHVLSQRLHLNGRYEQCMAMVDERLRLEEQKGLRLMDKNLDGSPMCVDCITGAGKLKLKDTLICQAEKLPHFGMQVPRSFVGLRDKMWELKKDKCTLLSPEQYVMYAAEAGIPEGQKLEDATRFWHSQGWVLRFMNTASVELNGAVFTDPEYAPPAIQLML